MSAASSNFAKLKELANEPNSNKRRELLRGVTDLFFEEDHERSETEVALYDEILHVAARDLEIEVRAELADRISRASNAPRRIAKRFAMDQEIQVASPVLARSKALTDEDLVEVIQAKGSGHMLAITKRDSVSQTVSGELVNKGDDHVVASLLQNEGADLSRETYEQVTDRAKANKDLQTPFVDRKTVPLDLLNEMYLEVEAELREKIMMRNQSVPEAELERALANGRIRVAQSVGALPKDFETCSKWLEDQIAKNSIVPSDLVAYVRDGAITKFLLGLAHFTGVDFQTARRIQENHDVDSLAMLCRAAKFDRALFVTLAVFVGGRTDNSIKAASEFGELYSEIPVLAAQRAVRFWKVRHTQERHAA